MQRHIYWLVVFCCLLQGYAAAITMAQQTQADTRDTTTIPFIIWQKGGQLLIKVGLDDRIVGTFLVDTGATTSCLEASVAKKLGLSPEPALGKDGVRFSFNGKPADKVTVSNCKLGTFPPITFDFLLLNGNLLSTDFHQEVDGILGGNIFEAVAALFDFQKHQITFWYPGNLAESDLKTVGMTPSSVVPIAESGDDNLIRTSVRFDNAEKENLVVDTGSTITQITPLMARQLKLQAIERGIAYKHLFDTIKMDRARLRTLSVGNLILSDVKVDYSQDDKAKYNPCLGLNVLTKYMVLIDLPQNKMFLKPISTDEKAKQK